MATNAAVPMILRTSISSLGQQLLQGTATLRPCIMGVRHGAEGAAGLPRSIEAYALPHNCAIERSEAGGGFDGVLPSGVARLLGIIQRARTPRVIFLPTSR